MSYLSIYIPDVLRNWPWKRAVNPYYEQCKAESEAWAENFHVLNPKAQDIFNKCDMSLMASMAYPKLSKEALRVGCDAINLIVLLDDWSEESDAIEMRNMADIIMDAFRNPQKPRPDGEWAGGELARQYWANAIKVATPLVQKQFIKIYQEYTDAVVQQCKERDQSEVYTVESYFDARRITVGIKPLIIINRLQMEIPDYVMDNEIIQRLHICLLDMISIANDIYSYNKEQARGDEQFNLVTVVMHQRQLDLQSAYDWIGSYHDEVAAKFLNYYSKIPSWGKEVDRDVSQYLDDLGNWVRANEKWSFESQRYFGTDGLCVMKKRTFTVLPKTEYVSIRPGSG